MSWRLIYTTRFTSTHTMHASRHVTIIPRAPLFLSTFSFQDSFFLFSLISTNGRSVKSIIINNFLVFLL